MAHEEVGNQEQISRILGAQAELGRFVADVAEIQTTLDYFKGGMHAAHRQAKELFEKHPLANQPVIISLRDGSGQLVNRKTREFEPYDGVVLGYMESFYVLAQPVDVASVATSADIEHEDLPDFDRHSELWRDPKTPVVIDLGVRVRPIYSPARLDPDEARVELRAEDIETVVDAVDSHPFLPELEIFDQQFRGAARLSRALSMPDKYLHHRVSEFVEDQGQASNLYGCAFWVDFHPEAAGFITDDLTSTRAFLANLDHEDQNLPPGVELRGGFTRAVRLISFDWLQDSHEEDEEASASLWGVFELEDERDIDATNGSNIVAIPLDYVRFGAFLSTKNPVSAKPVNLFCYQETVFKTGIRSIIDNPKLSTTSESVEEALTALKTMLNEADIDHMGAAMKARVIDATIQVRIAQAEVVHSVAASTRELGQVVLHAQQDVVGVVKKFVVADYGEDNDMELRLMCRLDVSEDRYFSTKDVREIDLPIDALCDSRFVSGGVERHTYLGRMVTRSTYPDAN